MEQIPPRRRRARPVADAPIDALLAHAEDLTKGWLLALLERAPLDEAPRILAADLARDGPRLCDAVVRALADDADLRRLEPGGALELLVSQTGQFAGARGVEATSRAVDMLGTVIWSGIRGELPRPDPDQISELAERLALVIELVRGAALRRCAGEAPAPRAAAGSRHVEVLSAEPDTPDRGLEDRDVVPPVPPDRAPVRPAPPAAGAPVRSWPDAPVLAQDSLWVGAVEDEIARAEQSGGPLSLLLVELEDVDRLLAVDPPPEVSATFGRFAQAVRGAVRRQDTLACETDARAWIIARATGRLGAQALGSRIVGAVRAAQPWRGAPLSVSVGVSVLGEDGRDCASLIEAAEEAKFVAEASGIGIAHGLPAEGAGEPSGGSGPKLVS